MKPKNRELLDEMIQYSITRVPIKYLKKAFDEMGDKEIVMPLGYLLSWHKGFLMGAEKPDRYDVGELGLQRYKMLFELIPELTEIFSLNKDHIGWSNKCSKSEQEEIRNYIHENFKVEIRSRRTMP